MRYATDHKAQTRQKLVRDAASLAKQEGFAASGVDALARAAGLTSGAFYKHFESKDELLAAVCDAELERTRARFASIDPESREEVLRAIDGYLSLAHVRNPGAGCVLPALAAEIGRAPISTRTVLEGAFRDLVAVVALLVGDRALANALVTQCVGAVMLARALASEDAQHEVLASARAGARRLLAG